MVMRETSKIKEKERERGEDHKGQSEGNAATKAKHAKSCVLRADAKGVG